MEHNFGFVVTGPVLLPRGARSRAIIPKKLWSPKDLVLLVGYPVLIYDRPVHGLLQENILV